MAIVKCYLRSCKYNGKECCTKNDVVIEKPSSMDPGMRCYTPCRHTTANNFKAKKN